MSCFPSVRLRPLTVALTLACSVASGGCLAGGGSETGAGGDHPAADGGGQPPGGGGPHDLGPAPWPDDTGIRPWQPQPDVGGRADLGTDRPDLGGPEPADLGGPEPADLGGPAAPDLGPPPDPEVNPGWIGGPCRDVGDCDYDDALCLSEPGDAFPGGTCSQACDRFCPDREGDAFTVTFCVAGVGGQGRCVARCDFDLLPGGCRPGYVCSSQPRYGEAATEMLVCLPEAMVDPGDGPGPCMRQALDLGLRVEPGPDGTDHPDGNANLTCRLEEPLYLSSPVVGADYRYSSRAEPSRMYMACPLALALHRLGVVLAEYDIVEVQHMGTYNCRTMRGGDALSLHGLGLAIDLSGFVDRAGREYSVEHHWETLEGEPRTAEGAFLKEIAWRMHEERIFNIVLTPEYNAAHYNHFHVDLSPGSNFLGKPGDPPEPFIGTFAGSGEPL